MATNDPYDLTNILLGRTHTTTQRMIEALAARAGQPNPSLGGALANGLAMGLLGLVDKNEGAQNSADSIKSMDSQVAAMGGEGAPQGYPAAPRWQPDGTVPPPSVSSIEPEKPKPLAQALTASPSSPSDVGPMVGALRGSPSELDMASKDVADSLAAQGMPVTPEAVAQLAKVESGANPRATTGSYSGATQMGPQTFREAGGRLGGLTYPEYQNGSLTQQMWAYPDWLQQYKIPDKLQAAGIDTGQLPPNQQYGVLQAAQFAPNGDRSGSQPPPWMTAFGQGNPNVPATNTPQARVLGNTSVAAMAASPPGQATMTPGAGVGVPMTPGTPGAGLPQPPPAVTTAPPQPTPQPIIDMQRQTDRLRELYQNTTNPQAKAGIFKQLIEQQNQLRTMQMELQKSTMQKQQPSYGDLNAGALEAQKKAASLPYEQIIKQTPNADEQMKIDTANRAKQILTDTVRGSGKNLMALNSMDNAIPNSDKGPLDNFISTLSASPYLGQPIGRALGTQEQSVRNELMQTQPALISAIRQATQMGARGLDSNVELAFYMQQTADPTKDVWSNLAALDKLDKAYGLGNGLKDVLSPEQYARVEKGSAALSKEYSDMQKSQGGQPGQPDAEGWVTLPNGTRIRERK